MRRSQEQMKRRSSFDLDDYFKESTRTAAEEKVHESDCRGDCRCEEAEIGRTRRGRIPSVRKPRRRRTMFC